MPSGTSHLSRQNFWATISVHVRRDDRYLLLLSRCKLLVWSLVTILALHIHSSTATPITQTLVRSSSSISFGIDSPNPSLQMRGSFSDFHGSIDLDPHDIAQSQVQVSLSVSSAQLPPDQLLQALLLQTALSRIPKGPSTFRSSRIEHIDGMTYLLHGNYSWMRKERAASVPVEIARSSPALTEIRVLLSSALRDGKLPPDLAGMAGQTHGARGWSRATLIFARAKE